MQDTIFVSYSHEDVELVKPVVSLLRATRGLVFQDIDGLKPGKKWRPQIDEAISAANLVVLFWCAHSRESDEVENEYRMALTSGKDVLPVLLDSTPLPGDLSEFQWIDFQMFVGPDHSALQTESRPSAIPKLRPRVLAPAFLALFGVGFFLWMFMLQRSGHLPDRPDEPVFPVSSTSERSERPEPPKHEPTQPAKPPLLKPELGGNVAAHRTVIWTVIGIVTLTLAFFVWVIKKRGRKHSRDRDIPSESHRRMAKELETELLRRTSASKAE